MNDFWTGKRVLVTGNTGFKGTWLTHWLAAKGAVVSGLALEPDRRSLFRMAGTETLCDHIVCDLRDRDAVRSRVVDAEPEVAFHLAAQSLVLRSHDEPVETWSTNVLGSIHLMEGLRNHGGARAVVMVTTDKVYENRDFNREFKEGDRLGGDDPYSSSKAAMEIAVSSWRRAFFARTGTRIASARAGNVIGGGDWAKDRLVPDIVRALKEKRSVQIRNPNSVRPWQHVLEPLHGYMVLAERLHSEASSAEQSFNFGPNSGDARSVAELVDAAMLHWPGTWETTSRPVGPVESEFLALDTQLAKTVLDVSPRWGFNETVAQTMTWYRRVHEGADPREELDAQIAAYERTDAN